MSSVYYIDPTIPYYVDPGYWISGYAVPETVFPTVWDYINELVNVNLINKPSLQWVSSPSTGEPDYSVPNGYVVSISPASGVTVNQWAIVQVTASYGPSVYNPYVTVPNIVGLTSFNASQALWAMNCTAASPTYSYSNTVANGLVISQSIAAGTSVLFGTYVNFVVSIGPASTPVTVVVP
jgi:beta-lactam-binding protein with PASTA domain